MSWTLFFLLQLIFRNLQNRFNPVILPALTRKHLVCCLNKCQRRKCQIKSSLTTEAFSSTKSYLRGILFSSFMNFSFSLENASSFPPPPPGLAGSVTLLGGAAATVVAGGAARAS